MSNIDSFICLCSIWFSTSYFFSTLVHAHPNQRRETYLCWSTVRSSLQICASVAQAGRYKVAVKQVSKGVKEFCYSIQTCLRSFFHSIFSSSTPFFKISSNPLNIPILEKGSHQIQILFPLQILKFHSFFQNFVQSAQYSNPRKMISSDTDPFSAPLLRKEKLNLIENEYF